MTLTTIYLWSSLAAALGWFVLFGVPDLRSHGLRRVALGALVIAVAWPVALLCVCACLVFAALHYTLPAKP